MSQIFHFHTLPVDGVHYKTRANGKDCIQASGFVWVMLLFVLKSELNTSNTQDMTCTLTEGSAANVKIIFELSDWGKKGAKGNEWLD